MTTPANNLTRLDTLSAEAILAIPQDEPEHLFTGNAADLKAEYRHLARRWHPDRNQTEKALNVFQHLEELHDSAEDKIARHIWQIPGELLLERLDGSRIKFNYLKKNTSDVGETYIGTNSVAFAVRKEFSDLFQNAIQRIKGLKFNNDMAKKQAELWLPKASDLKIFKTPDRDVLVMTKGKEFVLLSDLVDHLGGKIQPVHVGWILNRLYNLAVCLQNAGVMHGDISKDSVFISVKPSPAEDEDHSIKLLGGWWCAALENTKATVPNRTLDYAPEKFRKDRLADPRVDRELILLLARELLGDARGHSLKFDAKIPTAMSLRLQMPAGDNALSDFKIWQQKTLVESFGPPKYVQMNINIGAIYPHANPQP